MREDLFPYSEYKDSGFPCFGQIPAHWEVLRNGQIFSQRNQTGYPDLPILEVSLKSGVRVRDFENSKRKQIMNDREKYKRASKGDIAYNMMRMWQGAVGVAPVDGLVSPAYVVANPYPGVDSRYYSYLFRTQTYMNEVNKYSHGIVADRNRLYWDEFKQMPSLFPPSNEQMKIADFLDDHGRKVSRLVRTKRRQIDLLRELKQTVINNAVTRGLNSIVRLKPSGIDWIGDIPEHWEIKRNKNIMKIRKEVVGDEHRKYTLLSLTTNGIIERDIESGKGKFPADFSSYQKVYSGDLVFCLFDIDETPRTVGLSELNGMITGAYTVFSVNNIEKEYLFYYYLALDQKKALKPLYTGLRKVIPSDAFLRAKLALPPVEEQIEIVSYIKELSIIIDNAIQKAQREIDLLSEFHARVTTDAVTGKIDARDIKILDFGEDAISPFEYDGEETEIEEVSDLEECEV
nr:restriction endonuclease subunit S [Paenibacillus xylanexedens]